MPALLPKKRDVCDKCSGKLIQRADDTESTVLNRLKIYDSQTSPLVDYYTKQGILMEWQVKKGIRDVPALLKATEEALTKRMKGVKL